MTRYPITFRRVGDPVRQSGDAIGPDMESALATFKRDNPETISHCIYNPQHLES
ncbi:hypothetical protein [Sphingomonas phage Carli]|nr:hypothetical protein [Sphingomonas phage Carli]